MDGIYGFFGPYRFLSNFYQSRVKSPIDGLVYKSSEAAFQAAKTDDPLLKEIIQSLGPKDAKKLGKTVTLPDSWSEKRIGVMRLICREKFSSQNLKEKLLKTDGLYLEETNTWGDTFWGICKGVGENNLGKILMEIRNEIKNNEKMDIRRV